jgi:hypothetical protein
VQVRTGISSLAVGKVDEIHNIDMATSSGKDLSDHLKYFAEHPGHLRVRRDQRRARRAVHRGARQADRRTLRDAAHRHLPLRRRVALDGRHDGAGAAPAPPCARRPSDAGEIPAPAHRRQHQRLSHLIRAAAITAIATGEERLDRTVLDTVLVDHSTQADPPAKAGQDDWDEAA